VVSISAALKPELGMILEAFTLASEPHTHEHPQVGMNGTLSSTF